MKGAFSKKNLFFVLAAVIVIIVLITLLLAYELTYQSPLIADYDAWCDTDYCYGAVARYNQNISLCEKIANATDKETCRDVLDKGTFMFRQYESVVFRPENDSLQLDPNPFVNRCEMACNDSNKEFIPPKKPHDIQSTSILWAYDTDKSLFINLFSC